MKACSTRWTPSATSRSSIGRRTYLSPWPFGVYVHVPWCASRCGYCDFNTYVPRGDEPSAFAATAARRDRADAPRARRRGAAGHRLRRRRDADAARGRRPLPRRSQALRPAAGAEVTIEANPESVDERKLAALREAGFTRVSIGMQSAGAHVLRDARARAHAGPRAVAAAREARAARLRARLAGPHLRHAGRDRRRLARAPSKPRCPRSPTTSARTRSSSSRARG